MPTASDTTASIRRGLHVHPAIDSRKLFAANQMGKLQSRFWPPVHYFGRKLILLSKHWHWYGCNLAPFFSCGLTKSGESAVLTFENIVHQIGLCHVLYWHITALFFLIKAYFMYFWRNRFCFTISYQMKSYRLLTRNFDTSGHKPPFVSRACSIKTGCSPRVQLEWSRPPFIEVQLIFQYLWEPWHRQTRSDVRLMENAED